jgi:hypothetical protein
MPKKNENPPAYTTIYWLIQDGKIDPNDLFNFSQLYWPTFVKKDGYVFLKDQYSEEEYKSLTKENENPEYWLNLLTIDEFFSELSDGEDKSVALSKTLAEIWEVKLKKDFPNMTFTVECVWNEEYGDCGLTFYQTDESSTPQENKCFNEIVSPNIKENKIVQSSNGPRPGLSKIRKPRHDEIPQ